jgi:AraC-like DNA-binding protein
VQVGLNPVLARAALGVDFCDLRGQSIELSDLLGPRADLLLDQVAAAPSWDGRFSLVEQFLAGCADRAAPSRAASYGWGRLVGSRGRLRVADLAAEMGMSRQRLALLFREHVGVSPKTLAAIARMRHAIALLSRDPRRPVADIAIACGYSDQQHLSRDLTRLAGRPPASLRADLLPGDGGIAVRC